MTKPYRYKVIAEMIPTGTAEFPHRNLAGARDDVDFLLTDCRDIVSRVTIEDNGVLIREILLNGPTRSTAEALMYAYEHPPSGTCDQP